ncbi:MAG TPA: hypothetical protein VF762_16350, partial [Blastocatellia bacterium]
MEILGDPCVMVKKRHLSPETRFHEWPQSSVGELQSADSEPRAIFDTITGMITKHTIPLCLLILLFAFGLKASAAPATMRLDYYHTGNASQEMFSVDRVVMEPLPWP